MEAVKGAYLKPPSSPLTVRSVAKAYAERDTILQPNLTPQCRMSKHVKKLAWHEESDRSYSNRVKNEAMDIFLNSAQDNAMHISEIWDQAKKNIHRRQENERARRLSEDTESGMALEMLYRTHFTLDELIWLGW